MSTPRRVVAAPSTPVTMPAMPAHQVALLIRGLRRYQEVQQGFHRRGSISDEGFAERHAPARAAETALQQALDEWTAAHGGTRPANPGALDAVWPSGPPVELGALTLTQLWRLRLATDWVLVAELDAERSTGQQMHPAGEVALAAAQQTIFATLRAHRVRDFT